VETEAPRLVGTTVADFRGIWKEPFNARVVTSNDPAQCFDELISSVGALAAGIGKRPHQPEP
jgi:inosine-uridine nucleoside N-ribohydrolase